MSEKAVFVSQKELPPTVSLTMKKTTKANSCREQPNSQASEKNLPIYPEVYYNDGPQVVSPTIPEIPEVQTGEGLEIPFGGLETKPYGNDPLANPEVRTGEGLERTFDGLETKPNGYDPPTPVEQVEESMPLRRRRKRILIGLVILAVVLLVALAAGLGGGLGSRKRYITNIRVADQMLTLFDWQQLHSSNHPHGCLASGAVQCHQPPGKI